MFSGILFVYISLRKFRGKIMNGIRLIKRYCGSFKPYYVTTPIFYVNAAPHIGHLYSAVIADATVRFQQLICPERATFLSTGTDEHGTKIQQAASIHGTTPNAYCDRISSEYQKLFQEAGIQHDRFIRTTDLDHVRAVAEFWRRLDERGHIYSTKYSGWYCISDETFLTETQLKTLPDGQRVSEESGHPVEWTEETNYMFRLSTFQEEVIRWAKAEGRIRPKKFQTILLNMLNEEIPDVSISRPASRVPWAIKVPTDASQTVYVWLDALVNYLTCAGFPNPNFVARWPASLQVLGKDILKFHAIYWPAFLLGADIEPPKALLIHSHWTVDGQKMSKSRQNVVNPRERAKLFTMEGVRYFLLREGTAHSDANYSETKALCMLNAELADTLGNLLSRCCAKTLNPRQVCPAIDPEEFQWLNSLPETQHLLELLTELPEKCRDHYEASNFYLAVDAVVATLHAANKFVDATKPWELKNGTPEQTRRLEAILSVAMEALVQAGIVLQPIVPEMSKKLLDKLSCPRESRLWRDLGQFSWHREDQSKERSLGLDPPSLFKKIILPKEQKSEEKKVKSDRPKEKKAVC